MTELTVAVNPCESCPYRRDVPPGVWHRSEYEKLRDYDETHEPALGIFLCHHSPNMEQEAICRGWLTVHADSIAVRLAVLQGNVTPDQRDAPVTVPLFEDGNQAADAGIKGIRRPNDKARQIINRLDKQRKR